MKRASFLAWVFELGKGALILAVIGLFVHYFIATIFAVKGESMEPNFKDGEYLVVNRISYFIHAPNRGDVVALKFPGREQDKYIKRIIGLPNETVEIKSGTVYINGGKLKEDYLPYYTKTSPDMIKTLRSNEYFVLGDNRDNSNDSRFWGTCPRENLLGKAIFTLFPLSDWSAVPSPAY